MNKKIVLQNESDFLGFLDVIDERNFQQRTPKDFKNLKKIFSMVGYPMTIVYEPVYVDRVFRDSFYLYYAGKYNAIDRNCKRLAFFKGVIRDFNQPNIENILQEQFVGISVIKPLSRGRLGRTLLNPGKLKIRKCYLRLTEFEFTILDYHLKLKAFPFSSQDGETMTCAETSLWDILEYFSHQYAEYRSILPSDIHRSLESISQQRNLPSTGLHFGKISLLLKEYGFAPRIYAANGNSGYSDEDIRRAFHYYIESGIPIVVGVAGELNIRHSIVCIGHGKERKEIVEENITPITYKGRNVPYIDSADLYDEYVVMDDNSYPYAINSYEKLPAFGDAKVELFIVPLYKRVFLEAQDIQQLFISIMEHSELSILKMLKNIDEEINNENPLISRFFLTSSRKFRGFRNTNENALNGKKIYQKVLYPKFVWVAEIFTRKSYEEGFAYGEIVFDATALRYGDLAECIIMLRYLSNFGYRYPEEDLKELSGRMEKPVIGLNKKFPMYKNNLNEVGVDEHDSHR